MERVRGSREHHDKHSNDKKENKCWFTNKTVYKSINYHVVKE